MLVHARKAGLTFDGQINDSNMKICYAQSVFVTVVVYRALGCLNRFAVLIHVLTLTDFGRHVPNVLHILAAKKFMSLEPKHWQQAQVYKFTPTNVMQLYFVK